MNNGNDVWYEKNTTEQTEILKRVMYIRGSQSGVRKMFLVPYDFHNGENAHVITESSHKIFKFTL